MKRLARCLRRLADRLDPPAVERASPGKPVQVRSALQFEIIQIERALEEHGVSVDTLMEAAGINRSTWTRWKSGAYAPRLTKWRDVRAAVDRLTNASSEAP